MNTANLVLNTHRSKLYITTCLLLTFMTMTSFSNTVFSGTQKLKITTKLDKTSIAQANKLAVLYMKIRTAYINYDIPFVLKNSFTPKNTKFPPRSQMANIIKSVSPDIYHLKLIEMEAKGKVIGLWMLPITQPGKSKLFYMFRFKRDNKDQWRLLDSNANDVTGQKQSAKTLLLKLTLNNK